MLDESLSASIAYSPPYSSKLKISLHLNKRKYDLEIIMITDEKKKKFQPRSYFPELSKRLEIKLVIQQIEIDVPI